MEINVFQVDAFSSESFGGNPAGVVPNSKSLNARDMQKIAKEMNLSETAFVQKLDDNLFKVRFFTPICEVDLCGHATIATFYTMAKKGYIKSIENGVKRAELETNIGTFPIDINYKNGEPIYILMEQDSPKSLGVLKDIDGLLESMNLIKEQVGILDEYIDPEIISTGLPDIILPIKDRDIFDNLDIDFNKLSAVSKNNNVTGVHAFYLPEKNSKVVYVRNFAPLVGIDEESATGTANGALIYYLKKNKLIVNNEIVALQGSSLNRPSEIYCFIEEDEDGFKIKVGGNAMIVIEGIIKF